MKSSFLMVSRSLPPLDKGFEFAPEFTAVQFCFSHQVLPVAPQYFGFFEPMTEFSQPYMQIDDRLERFG